MNMTDERFAQIGIVPVIAACEYGQKKTERPTSTALRPLLFPLKRTETRITPGIKKHQPVWTDAVRLFNHSHV